MAKTLQIETARLTLREWQARDRAPFAAMNADAQVMRYFDAPLTQAQSDESVARYERNLQAEGFSFMVAREKSTNEFVGILGMQTMSFAVPGLPQPAVEIGWRLTTAAQGRGLATEGAQAVVDHAFDVAGLSGVVAVTTPMNTPSRRVMEKLGMTFRPELTFAHPRVPAGSHCSQHVLYRLANARGAL